MKTTRRSRRSRRWSSAEEDHLYKVGLLHQFVRKRGWSALTRKTRMREINLYSYVVNSRIRYREGKITDAVMRALELIPDWTWEPWRDHDRETIAELRRVVAKVGWKGLEAHNPRLAFWCRNRRAEHRRGAVTSWVRKALEAIPGWHWDPIDQQYDLWLQSLRSFVAEHGWNALKRNSRDEANAALGNWVNWVRYQYRCNRLPDWVLLTLDPMDGWTWNPIDDGQRRKVELLRAFVVERGWDAFDFRVVVDDIALGSWANSCLSRERRGELPTWLRQQLDTIPGWQWRT